MAGQKELWIEAGDAPELISGESSTLVLMGRPRIHFLRGSEMVSTSESEGGDNPHTEFDSPVVAPVPKAVAAHWKQAGRPPDEACLVRLTVEPGVLTQPKAKLKAGSKTLELDMERTEEGFASKELLLFVYGDGTVGEGDFPGIKAVDAGKGDAFEPTVEFEAGSDKRKLGLVDVLIKDPEDGKYRTARSGIFKTRALSAKLICPRVGANNLKVVFDDGIETSPDEIDITGLADPAGDVTEVELPWSVSPDDARVKAEWDPKAVRSRLIEEPEEEGKSLALFLLGENRVRILDKSSGRVLYTAHFLSYADDEETVPGTFYGSETVTVDDLPVDIARNHILLCFKEAAKDAGLSRYLHAFGLVPQGFSGSGNLVQAAPRFHASGEWLKSLAEDLKKVRRRTAGGCLPGHPVQDRGLAQQRYGAVSGGHARGFQRRHRRLHQRRADVFPPLLHQYLPGPPAHRPGALPDGRSAFRFAGRLPLRIEQELPPPHRQGNPVPGRAGQGRSSAAQDGGFRAYRHHRQPTRTTTPCPASARKSPRPCWCGTRTSG